ncbi:hypothetical protein V8J88_01980 [Massilia sp. W12]|uniref:hypothetical protein n=1 Tax=Massilia sp. W12 TaxID=3126507 RepID=UPI0030CD9892
MFFLLLCVFHYRLFHRPRDGLELQITGGDNYFDTGGAIIFVFSFLICSLSGAASFPYGNLLHDRSSSFEISQEGVRTFDVISEAKFCKASDDFWCVNSVNFRFSVPKKIQKFNSWSKDNALYKVKSINERVFNNAVVKYYVIEQDFDGQKITYAYSQDFGVLLIKHENGGELSIIKKCGFAATNNRHGCKAPSISSP